MITTIRSLAYLVASLLFILSLARAVHQETARRGNLYGIIGMLIAVVMTALALLAPATSRPCRRRSTLLGVLVGALVIGGVDRRVRSRARRDDVDAASWSRSCTASSAPRRCWSASPPTLHPRRRLRRPAEARIHEVEIYVGVFIGAVTFTGSMIAFGKLRGLIGSKPLLLPGATAST